MTAADGYTLYWGDLHSHCNVSYGAGSPERAFACAREQLDFCSITGHAFWPDMPTDRERHARAIDSHRDGFARCQENWGPLTNLAREVDEPGRFVPFLSYEWHSLASGDHNVYYRDLAGSLIDGPDLDALEDHLRQQGAPFMVVPHHIGYRAGQRGINWDHFREARSPLVEIFSMHGCSESDLAPYPFMHSMGPRDSRSTAEHGLLRGHTFGIIGSTDHHGGFPGSYGSGRVGVWARSLTRDDLWDALTARRTCAITGDKIEALLRVNGAWPGEERPDDSPARQIEVAVTARDFIDHVEVLKNETVLARIPGPFPTAPAQSLPGGEIEAKVRIEWGWGPSDLRHPISGELTALGGAILDVEPCFRGETVLTPDATLADPTTVPHRITERDERRCAWQSIAAGNPSPIQAETQALIVTVRMAPAERLRLRMNDLSAEVSLRELLDGSRTYNLRGWLSEAVRLHRAVPRSALSLTWTGEDNATGPRDWYRLRVAQRNGQWAWTSPIWMVR